MHLLISLIIVIVLIRVVLRLLGFGRHYRRPFMGYGNGYGWNNGYGHRHRHRFGGGLFSILALVALERLFTRRF